MPADNQNTELEQGVLPMESRLVTLLERKLLLRHKLTILFISNGLSILGIFFFQYFLPLRRAGMFETSGRAVRILDSRYDGDSINANRKGAVVAFGSKMAQAATMLEEVLEHYRLPVVVVTDSWLGLETKVGISRSASRAVLSGLRWNGCHDPGVYGVRRVPAIVPMDAETR